LSEIESIAKDLQTLGCKQVRRRFHARKVLTFEAAPILQGLKLLALGTGVHAVSIALGAGFMAIVAGQLRRDGPVRASIAVKILARALNENVGPVDASRALIRGFAGRADIRALTAGVVVEIEIVGIGAVCC
jgi:hypothetical protein